LEDYPIAQSDFIDESLRQDMARTQQIVSLGLALRATKKVRVRQPLASISIVENIEEYYQNIICEELNVKEVKILSNPDAIAKKICMPNAKKIGPKFGKETQSVIDAAKRGEFKDLGDGSLEILGKIITADEYEMAYQATNSNFDVLSGAGTVIAMDMHVSEELLYEGIARDMIRSIQEARKEAGFDVTDKITLAIAGDEVFMRAAREYQPLIESETLSSLKDTLETFDFQKTVEDDEESYTLTLKR